jgi:hypothetical protein
MTEVWDDDACRRANNLTVYNRHQQRLALVCVDGGEGGLVPANSRRVFPQIVKRELLEQGNNRRKV